MDHRSDLIAQIPDLRRYARLLTSDAWAADDLVQDTLERACSKWRLWTAGSNLRTWLFTLMHNQFVDQVRRSARQSAAGFRVDLDDVSDELQAVVTGRQDMALDIERCLMRLPQEQRAVLLLVSVEDLSYAEVARITGVPLGTVMSRLSRGRNRLRELMEGRPDKTSSPPTLRRLK